ncbi:hypothetical protein AMECASPLE_026387 [Ameca splendens]|uniref:Uncharacterized protein n=1 Tax=Ameca splendens TaxID=208324 RepID=A0ABV0YG13_9TELE
MCHLGHASIRLCPHRHRSSHLKRKAVVTGSVKALGCLQFRAFVSSLLVQKTQTLSLQENFTDYLLSWLHVGFKAPQASFEQTWLILHGSRLQDYPPGATSTSSASKTGLPGPFTYPTRSRSFHLSSPPLWWLSNSAKYIKINNPEYFLPLTTDPFSIQRRVPGFPSIQLYFIINLLNLLLFPECISTCGSKQLENR